MQGCMRVKLSERSVIASFQGGGGTHTETNRKAGSVKIP